MKVLLSNYNEQNRKLAFHMSEWDEGFVKWSVILLIKLAFHMSEWDEGFTPAATALAAVLAFHMSEWDEGVR